MHSNCLLNLIFSLCPPFIADDFSSQDNLDEPEAGGWDATLIAEDEDEFFELQIVKHHESEVRQYSSIGVGRVSCCKWEVL